MKIGKKYSIVFVGILAGLILKFFVLDILHVSGHSMEPTLKNNSSVVVNKLSYGLVKPFSGSFIVQWGKPLIDDIVIFLHDNKIVVKRCVAVEGDYLDFSDESQYNLCVNDIKVKLTKSQYESLQAFSHVPDGYVFVLGDNRADSIDSRDYGFVSVKNITGKIIGK